MRDYATQMEAAKKGIITPEMKTVAEKEYTDPEMIRARVALGQIAIPANINHKSLCAEGIGKGLRTKINVNLGISGDAKNYEVELDKVRMALKFGAEGSLARAGRQDFAAEPRRYEQHLLGQVQYVLQIEPDNRWFRQAAKRLREKAAE